MTNHLFARELAENSIVLLKNEDRMLPLREGQNVAIFGRAQTETILSGNGSGAVSAENAKNILDACEGVGLKPVKELAAFYRSCPTGENTGDLDWSDLAAMSKLVHSGAIYEYFGQYRPTPEEIAVTGQQMEDAARQSDTAIYVLGRCAGGEECDRHLENDYYLSDAENLLVEQICGCFPNVALVLNVNGLIDLSWAERYPAIRSILFLGIPGEAGAEALARILTGDVCPSGKMAVTIPRHYRDFPCAEDFSWNKNDLSAIKTYGDYGLSAENNGSCRFALSPVTVYREGVYNGYRYFDTFLVEPLYFFGHGLSYTEFTYGKPKISRIDAGLELRVSVTNTGSHAGREVVQVYIDAGLIEEDMPLRTLQGFAKTDVLSPGQSENVCILIPWRGFSHYDEEAAAWVISEGTYMLCLGGDVHAAEVAAVVRTPERILVEQCTNLLVLQSINRSELEFIKKSCGETDERSSLSINNAVSEECSKILLFRAEMEENSGMEQSEISESLDLSGFSVEELASLCVGYGPGTPFSAFGDQEAPSAIHGAGGKALTVNDHKNGLPGYVSPAMPGKGIHSVSYGDGPAGIGLTAWPSEMLLACSFDEALCRRFGDAVGSECEEKGVDVWLAPAVNLHRHPLCGRAFEYFSEDPFLTGKLALSIVCGVQDAHPVLVCPKHFAANEQETFRRGSARLNVDAADSIVEERTLRELYLRPFEMLVWEGSVHCIMTSFNKINGIFSAGNKELCTDILRGEWKFDGMVVTDWGDMDTVVDGADAIAAGNDVIMPGGPPVIRQILQGLKEGRVNRGQLELAVRNFLQGTGCLICCFSSLNNNSAIGVNT